MGDTNDQLLKQLIDRSKMSMDLIQQDFPGTSLNRLDEPVAITSVHASSTPTPPATPSMTYSKRLLLNADGRFDQDMDPTGQVRLWPAWKSSASHPAGPHIQPHQSSLCAPR